MKRVLIIGGYGNFGSFIAKRLSQDEDLELIIAGRSIKKAQAFVATLIADTVPAAGVKAIRLDITEGLDEALAELKPQVLIHTSGPFQWQGYEVARAAIKAGCHYIDLADGREFVASIGELDEAAKQANVVVVSGASSVPGLSSALVDYYLHEFEVLESVDYAITTAQKTNRGLATTAAILGYTGKPFETLKDGVMVQVYGWQGLGRRQFNKLGNRWLSLCDIPDLAIFPKRYPHLKSLRFRAGLEISVMHLSLWALSFLVRWRLLSSLQKFARPMLATSFWFDPLGSDTSAFFMELVGKGKEAYPHKITFDLIARSGDGPYIPCIPAILLARRLARGEMTESGAMSCAGLIALNDYLGELEELDIEWVLTRG